MGATTTRFLRRMPLISSGVNSIGWVIADFRPLTSGRASVLGHYSAALLRGRRSTYAVPRVLIAGAVFMSQVSKDVVSQLAPEGVLRAGINLSNFLLVTGKSPAGDPA